MEEGVEMSSYQRFLSFAADRERGNQYLLFLFAAMHSNTNDQQYQYRVFIICRVPGEGSNTCLFIKCNFQFQPCCTTAAVAKIRVEWGNSTLDLYVDHHRISEECSTSSSHGNGDRNPPSSSSCLPSLGRTRLYLAQWPVYRAAKTRVTVFPR